MRADRRARRLTLRVCASTRLIRVTAPAHVPRARIHQFVEQHRPWIERQARRLPPVTGFQPGASIPFLGESLLLEQGQGRVARLEGDRLLVPGEGSLFAGRVRRWLSAQAEQLLEQESRALADRLGRPVRSVRVGDFRSRWGRCAHDGALAFSWRLVLAPAFVRHSVVAHEVAHLVHLNHGSDFWALATELLGQPHDKARHWLKMNGALLMSYGRDC